MKELLTLNKIQTRKKFVKTLIERQYFTPEDQDALQNFSTDQLGFMVQNARMQGGIQASEAEWPRSRRGRWRWTYRRRTSKREED